MLMEYETRKFCAIINPAAGTGECLKKYKIAKCLLHQHKITFNEKVSEYRGHIPVLIEQALFEGADTIVIVGGDGTIREAIPALVYKAVDVFMFPFGTGNDFARFLGIASEPGETVRQLLCSQVRQIDAAKANESYYINVAGFGFDVQVLINTERFKKKFKNSTAYLFGLVSALVHLKNYDVTLETANGTKQRWAMIVSAGNGSYIGGGMAALPQADISDNKLDICVMHNVKKRRVPPVLLKFLKGKHVDLPETDYFRTDTVTARTEVPLPVQLDGEIIEKTPVTFQVLPGAIRMLLPVEQTQS